MKQELLSINLENGSKLVIGMAILFAVSFILTENEAFGHMESMTIKGPQKPYANSVFNIHVDVEGVSRASHGIFRMIMTIFEKESGEELVAVPDYLKSGLNTIQINMIPDGYSRSFKENMTYILKIQHVNIISEHEFTPVKIKN